MHFHRIKKVISLITLVAFICSNSAYGAPSSRSLFKNKKVDYQKLSTQREEAISQKKAIFKEQDDKKEERKREAQRVLSTHLQDLSQIHIPAEYGRVIEVYDAKRTDERLVVHIQDLHTNPEAELNLASILELLIKDYGLDLVCSEGATSKVDTSSVSTFPDYEVREKVARLFINSGELTGEEYLSITKYPDLPIWGVEDRDIYFQNIIEFNKIMKFSPQSQQFISQAKKALKELKPKIYSKELLEIDQKEIDYETRTIETDEYLGYLASYIQKFNIPVDKYKNISILTESMKKEKEIDNIKIMQESQNLLLNLHAQLSRKDLNKEMDSLEVKAELFKDKKISPFSFYSYLKDMALKYLPKKLTKYPNLNDFIDYLTKVNSLDSTKLFVEMEDLTYEIKQGLSKNNEQKTLVKALRNINFLEGFFNLKVSNEELDYYLQNRETHKVGWFKSTITNLTNKTNSTNYIDFNPEYIDPRLKELEDFYKTVKDRDVAMVDNSITEIEKRNAKVSALISGGFHTKGITRLLRDQSYSYIVVSPYSSTDIDEENYHFLLSGRRKPITELLKQLDLTEIVNRLTTSLRIPLAFGLTQEEIAFYNGSIAPEVARISRLPLEQVKIASIVDRMAGVFGLQRGAETWACPLGFEIKVGQGVVLARCTDGDMQARCLRLTAEEAVEISLDEYRDFRGGKLIQFKSFKEVEYAADIDRGEGGGTERVTIYARAPQLKDEGGPLAGGILLPDLTEVLERVAQGDESAIANLSGYARNTSPNLFEAQLVALIQQEREGEITTDALYLLLRLAVRELLNAQYPDNRGMQTMLSDIEGFKDRDVAYIMWLGTVAPAARAKSLHRFAQERGLAIGAGEAWSRSNRRRLLRAFEELNFRKDPELASALRNLWELEDLYQSRARVSTGEVTAEAPQRTNKSRLRAPNKMPAVVMASLLVFALSACGRDKAPTPNIEATVQAAVEATMVAGEVGSTSVVPATPTALPTVEPAPPTVSELSVEAVTPIPQPIPSVVESILNWINGNVSRFGLPLSFQVPDGFDWSNTLDEHQRMILKEGLVTYDGALAQILWAINRQFDHADKLTQVLWQGSLGELRDLRAYYSPSNTAEHPFIYSDPQGQDVSPSEQGRRGYFFRIIDVEGNYNIIDALTGQETTWQQWQPISGENAWAGVIGPLQTYYQKYGSEHRPDATELRLAEEIARAAILLQAENGGIRMSPIGTWHESGPEFFYNEISTENNLSWYASFRMLYEITGKDEYRQAMEGIARYLQWSYMPELGVFAQGAHYYPDRGWVINNIFATDCQTWAWAALGAETIDSWFGEGAAYRMWQKTKELAGVYDDQGRLIGLDFTDYRVLGRDPLNSVEWTGGGIIGLWDAARFYANTHPDWAESLLRDAESMREGMETLKKVIAGQTGYSYSSCAVTPLECPIGHGWYSPPVEVLSLASTAWVGFVDLGYNPFYLGGASGVVPAELGAVTQAPMATPTPQPTPTQPVPAPVQPSMPAETIASGIDDSWSDGHSFSCWAAGPFDLSGYESLRIIFPASQAGTHIRARLLPEGGFGDSPTGLNRTIYTIPQDGVVTISISEFPVSPQDLKNIDQISFHSGDNTWNDPLLDQGPEKQAIFESIEGVPAASTSSSIQQGEGAVAAAAAALAGTTHKGSTLLRPGITPVLFDVRKPFIRGDLNTYELDKVNIKIDALDSNEEVAVIAVRVSDSQEKQLKEYFGTRAIVLNLTRLKGQVEGISEYTYYDYFMEIITDPEYRDALMGEGLRLTPDRFEDARKHLDKA